MTTPPAPLGHVCAPDDVSGRNDVCIICTAKVPRVWLHHRLDSLADISRFGDFAVWQVQTRIPFVCTDTNVYSEHNDKTEGTDAPYNS